MSSVARARSRQPEGLSTGGQFATEIKSEPEGINLSPAAAPAEDAPADFRAALVQGHKQLTEAGMSRENATGYLVGTAALQLAKQHLEHGRTANVHGHDGASVAYLQSHQAAAAVAKDAAEHSENPEALAAGVRQARARLGATTSLFRGFGPNAVSSITGETDQFLADMEGFIGEVGPSTSREAPARST